MTTRFTAVDQVNNGISGVKSGYDGLKSDFVIPSCGIEDVDVALFNLFEKEIQPMVGGQDSSEIKKVPVVFAAGEKWALLKRGKPIRDKNNTLILPLITIMRSSMIQETDDIMGRGINQQTGEIVVRRRLDKSDRAYQNLINKTLITSQRNVGVNPGNETVDNQVVTGRKVGELDSTLNNTQGAYLASSIGNNIYETIVVPAPQFYTAKYQITVWAQYTQHMNQIIEKIVASFLPQAQSWKVTTDKGYWFIASMEGGEFAIETNFEDMSSAERFIKSTFQIKIPAYFWVPSTPGAPIPVKKYVSSPIIQFAIAQDNVNDPATATEEVEEFYNNFTIGNDDPTLPLSDKPNARPDQRRTGSSLTPNQGVVQTSNPNVVPAGVSPSSSSTSPSTTPGSTPVIDPALSTTKRGVKPSTYSKVVIPKFPSTYVQGNQTTQTGTSSTVQLKVGNEIKYVKIVSQNAATGETVYSSVNETGLKIIPV